MANIKVKGLVSIKLDRDWYQPGEEFEMDEAHVKALLKQDPPKVEVLEDIELDEDSSNSNSTSESDTELDLFKELENMEDDFIPQLDAMGINTIAKLKAASKETLCDVKGIGEATAVKLIEELKDIVVEG